MFYLNRIGKYRGMLSLHAVSKHVELLRVLLLLLLLLLRVVTDVKAPPAVLECKPECTANIKQSFLR